MEIQINVANKHATVVGTPTIVCGNSEYAIKFSFDAEWSGESAKTARFVYTSGGVLKYDDVPFTGDTVSVPVLSNIREVYVGAFAGTKLATTPAVIPCEPSILCGASFPVVTAEE